MNNRPRTSIGDPLRGPGGAVVKFFFAALFGGMLVLPIYFVVLLAQIEFFMNIRLFHLLWIVPLVWGVLGIFWYERMLDLARDIIEAFLGSEN